MIDFCIIFSARGLQTGLPLHASLSASVMSVQLVSLALWRLMPAATIYDVITLLLQLTLTSRVTLNWLKPLSHNDTFFLWTTSDNVEWTRWHIPVTVITWHLCYHETKQTTTVLSHGNRRRCCKFRSIRSVQAVIFLWHLKQLTWPRLRAEVLVC